jgi:putative transposase
MKSAMRYEDYLNVPDHFYRNHLPHFDPKDAPYFVTYRLHGSIPKKEVLRLKALQAKANSGEKRAALFLEFDAILDRNGPYHLRQPEIRSIVMDSLSMLDGNEIATYAYTVLPNHVHAVFELHSSRELYRVMQSHKSFTGRQANLLLGNGGKPFWKKESYDRVVREGKLGSAIWYVLQNPVKAGFVKHWREWPGTYLSPNCHGFD